VTAFDLKVQTGWSEEIATLPALGIGRQPNLCGLLLCPALVTAKLSANLAARYSA
jgi:hypothetical protein